MLGCGLIYKAAEMVNLFNLDFGSIYVVCKSPSHILERHIRDVD